MEKKMTLGFGGSSALDHARKVAIQAGLARVSELCETGFKTRAAYDPQIFRDAVANSQAVLITSETTGTEYGFMLHLETLTDRHVHAMLIRVAGANIRPMNYRKLTLVNNDGTITALPGWR